VETNDNGQTKPAEPGTTVNIDAVTVRIVDQWRRRENNLLNRSAAIRELVKLGEQSPPQAA